MAVGMVKKSTIAVKKETGGYGVDPTVGAADIIRIEGIPELTDPYDNAEIDEMRNTYDTLPPIRTTERPTGRLTVNLRGAVTPGQAPEGDPLYECAIGAKNTSSERTTASGCTASSVIKTASGGHVVGDAIVIPIGADVNEVAWVTSVNEVTKTILVSPSFSQAPAEAKTIRAGLHYKLKNDDLASFWLAFWRGDITREDFAGNKIDSIELDIATGQIVKVTFNFKGNAVAFNAEACPYSGSFNALDPLIGLSQTLKIGGSLMRADRFQLRVNNEIQDRMDINSTGLSERIFVSRRVEGSFSVLYEDKAIADAFKIGTLAEAVLLLGRSSLAAGQTVVIRIPQMRYIETPVGADGKLWKYDVTWQGQMNAGEDSLSSISFL